MDLHVSADGSLRWAGKLYRCALGRSGIVIDKREGDGGTPVGCFALRRVFYRPDRTVAPTTALSVQPLSPQDGWCDDPDHADYNRYVRLPHPARHERMWRDDGLYDVVVVLGHNDVPPVAGQGSAIFLHVVRDDWQPTEGCVALPLADLLEILKGCDPETRLCVAQP